jgi:hypothetical protein
MHNSYDFLDSIKFPIRDCKDKKFLKFISSDKSETLIKLDTLAELWGIYLFDPGKKPKLMKSLEIGDEFNNYFR